ncbi:hypothetical protein [Streptomyces sp. NPDC088789]|uniref:hypothetical protein n=1 Tax=Streptomyces sp. NPDC088789 TaxID=3365899 RepID=UPI0037F8DE8B
MRTIRLGLVLGCSAALLLSGCSSSDPGPADRSRAGDDAPPVDFKNPPQVSATPSMGAARALELPLEAYEWTDDEERTRRQGEDLLAAACMRDFGFDLAPRPRYRGDKALRDANRYGVTDPDTASRFGYRIDPAARGPKPPGDDFSPAESLVLFGPQDGQDPSQEEGGQDSPQEEGGQDSSQEEGGQAEGTTADGKPVPKGGCWGKAIRDLAADGPKVDPDQEEFASQLAIYTFQEAQKDSRVKRVFADWSSCMKEQGFSYKGPMDPVEDRSFKNAENAETASDREIRVAVADVECKQRHNVVGVWYAVEVAYQERAVEQNQEQLNTLKERKESMLRAAAEAGATA